MNLNALTAHELLDLLKDRKTTGPEILQSVRGQIEKSDPQVKAYVRLTGAEKNKKNLEDGKRAPIPIAIKDNICIRNEETTCCSKILKGFKPPYNATVIDKLEASGSVFIGQANMDEF